MRATHYWPQFTVSAWCFFFFLGNLIMAHPLLTIVYGNCLFSNCGPLEFNYGPPTSHRSLRLLHRNKSNRNHFWSKKSMFQFPIHYSTSSISYHITSEHEAGSLTVKCKWAFSFATQSKFPFVHFTGSNIKNEECDCMMKNRRFLKISQTQSCKSQIISARHICWRSVMLSSTVEVS